MEYIKEGSTLPVPLNIIPTPKSIHSIFNKILKFWKRKYSEKPEIDLQNPERTHKTYQKNEVPNLKATVSTRKQSSSSDELTYIVIFLILQFLNKKPPKLVADFIICKNSSYPTLSNCKLNFPSKVI